MRPIHILGGARTPIGAFLGSLATVSAPELGAAAIRAALSRASVEPDQIDEVIMGNVLSAGIGQAPARQASIGAGIPNSKPCMTVNKVCGSGMKAAMLASQALNCGDAELIVAGGMESMSLCPYSLPKARTGLRMGHGEVVDLMIFDGLWDPYNNCHMGNCGDATAKELGYSREKLDEFAAMSVERALAAQAAGKLAEEIVAVEVKGRRGEVTLVSVDEQPLKADPAKLSGLRPAFAKDGVTTAGNASSINDGGCALVLASDEYVKRTGAKSLGRITAYTQHAQAPEWFTTAPRYAIESLLHNAGLAASDVDLFEINEAFAVVAMNVADGVGIPYDKVNVNGGAVALGHPIGMTGARLILTALMELNRTGKKRAVCSPCIGGGEATAVLVEAG